MAKQSFLLGVVAGVAAGYAGLAIVRRLNRRRGAAAEAAAGNVRSTTASGSTVYESARAVTEYLFFHFGADNEVMPYEFGPKSALGFPKRCAELCINSAKRYGAGTTRALDIGCAVGRSTLEMSVAFDEVVGIDFSHAFVAAAEKMRVEGSAEVQYMVEGRTMQTTRVTVPTGLRPEVVKYAQGDACNLSPSLGKFDVIHGANLLCRVPDPAKFLASLPQFLNPNGLVVLISPFSWLEEYTPVDKWVGGQPGVASRDSLMKIMSENFELVESFDTPFLIREHARKFQWGVSFATVFKLKATSG